MVVVIHDMEVDNIGHMSDKVILFYRHGTAASTSQSTSNLSIAMNGLCHLQACPHRHDRDQHTLPTPYHSHNIYIGQV